MPQADPVVEEQIARAAQPAIESWTEARIDQRLRALAQAIADDADLGHVARSAVLSLFTLTDAEEGLRVCRALLAIHGSGHTAILHSRAAIAVTQAQPSTTAAVKARMTKAKIAREPFDPTEIPKKAAQNRMPVAAEYILAPGGRGGVGRRRVHRTPSLQPMRIWYTAAPESAHPPRCRVQRVACCVPCIAAILRGAIQPFQRRRATT